MTKYYNSDYVWIKKIVAMHSDGISVKDIERILCKESKRLGSRPRDEKPPGRDKIYQIVSDYKGQDWTYDRGGGRRKTSKVKLIKEDQLSILGDAIKRIQLSEKIKKLDSLYDKRKRKLRLKDIIDLFRIKETILSYPMNVVFAGLKQHKNTNTLLEQSLVIAKKQSERIAEIELYQEDRNNEFSTIMRNLKQILDSDLLEAEIYANRRLYRRFLPPRNTIRRIYQGTS